MGLTLSPATLRDVPLLNAVRNVSRQWLHDSSSHTLPQAVEWFLAGGACQYQVLLLDGAPIGYCRVTDGTDAAEKFVGMDIHPDYRGRGFARPAYALLFAVLRASGVRRFRLRVLKTNERARHIYEALGFQVVADLQDEAEMLLDEANCDT